MCGGRNQDTTLDDCDYIDITSTGNAQDFGELTVARDGCATASGAGNAITAGGSNYSGSYFNTIDWTKFSNQSDATDFGDTSVSRHWNTACQDGIYAIFVMGKTGGSMSDDMDYVNPASAGNASDWGNQNVSSMARGGAGDGSRGVILGAAGIHESSQTHCDYFSFASPGNCSDFGDLSLARFRGGAGSNDTYALHGGGQATGSNTNRIDYFVIDTVANGTDFGDLTSSKTHLTGRANASRCVWTGDESNNTNEIEYVAFGTSGNASEFGNQVQGLRFGHGGASGEA